MNKKTVCFHILLLFSIQLLLLNSCISDHDRTADNVINYVEVGDMVPDFTLVEGTGEVFSSDAFVGKNSILFFFYTKCSDCEREIPIMEEVWKTLKDTTPDFIFLAIARGEEKDETDTYWKKHELTMPKYHDPQRSVFHLFANSYVPRLYIINKDKVVTFMAIERFNLTSSQILQLIKNLNG